MLLVLLAFAYWINSKRQERFLRSLSAAVAQWPAQWIRDIFRHLTAFAYIFASLIQVMARVAQGGRAGMKNDFKAASVLERLGQSLTDAHLDYQAGEGIHEFIVRLGGMRHVVDFTDDLMEKKNDKDLCVVILGIVERASTQSLPVHFMVRNDNFDKVMLALTLKH